MRLLQCITLSIGILTGSTGYPLQFWGYYLINSLPYENHISYWNNRLNTMDVLCFTGIQISHSRCSIPEFTSQQTLFKKAREYGIALIPHITFTSVQDGITFLTLQKNWEATIAALTQAIEKNAWDGIHFDFEYLPPQYAVHYAQFLKKVRATITGTIISAAIFPQVEWNTQYSSFHDLALLSPYLDAIVLMCYDYHNPKTKPGPVTSVSWTRKNIEYALKFFAPNQIWLGVPAYGYIWKNNMYYAVITMRSLPRYLSLYRYYRHNSGTIALTYTHHNDRFVAYVPDSKTHEQLIQLAKKYNLCGISLWRLGFE